MVGFDLRALSFQFFAEPVGRILFGLELFLFLGESQRQICERFTLFVQVLALLGKLALLKR